VSNANAGRGGVDTAISTAMMSILAIRLVVMRAPNRVMLPNMLRLRAFPAGADTSPKRKAPRPTSQDADRATSHGL
jgi:hypothetical protein